MVKKYPEITHIFNEHMKGGDGTVEVIPSVVQGEYESDANVIARLILKPAVPSECMSISEKKRSLRYFTEQRNIMTTAKAVR